MLNNNQLSSLSESFGMLTMDGDLYLHHNQLSSRSLPELFGSMTVGGDLELSRNKLQKDDIPTGFPNVGGFIQVFRLC